MSGKLMALLFDGNDLDFLRFGYRFETTKRLYLRHRINNMIWDVDVGNFLLLWNQSYYR